MPGLGKTFWSIVGGIVVGVAVVLPIMRRLPVIGPFLQGGL